MHTNFGQILSRAITLSKFCKKTMGNNQKLGLVNVDVHTKFGQILSIRSQDIDWKRNSDVNQGPSLRQNFAKNEG